MSGPLVLAVGSLQRRKGYETIIDALAALRRADVTLHTVREPTRLDGPSVVPEHLEAQILDASGHEVGPVFKAAIPAGNVILEAQASGAGCSTSPIQAARASTSTTA